MGFLRNTASDGFSAQKCKKMLDRLGGELNQKIPRGKISSKIFVTSMVNTVIPVGCVMITMLIFKTTVFCKLSKENSSESSNHEC